MFNIIRGNYTRHLRFTKFPESTSSSENIIRESDIHKSPNR
ncbi:1485_t:CDS:2 [Funneliformis geosporum]|uniref:150_t:CDS:1 n=1 Tax=Funneliformis geosporum TaxID=1117311 RepID=A0A9W4SHH4_9GLOM|nr:150_t:CDS:2 [Funneliformis geosporum]CAI2172136.1 1485_t:CDS:2 [Funneliformis geosporum]